MAAPGSRLCEVLRVGLSFHHERRSCECTALTFDSMSNLIEKDPTDEDGNRVKPSLDDECPICLQLLSGESTYGNKTTTLEALYEPISDKPPAKRRAPHNPGALVYGGCGHVYHRDCLKRVVEAASRSTMPMDNESREDWMHRLVCPVCKQPLPEEVCEGLLPLDNVFDVAASRDASEVFAEQESFASGIPRSPDLRSDDYSRLQRSERARVLREALDGLQTDGPTRRYINAVRAYSILRNPASAYAVSQGEFYERGREFRSSERVFDAYVARLVYLIARRDVQAGGRTRRVERLRLEQIALAIAVATRRVVEEFDRQWLSALEFNF